MSQSTFSFDTSNILISDASSNSHVEAARERQAIVTKPAGSLGRLEDIACQIAGIQRSNAPVIEN
jgi:nicotinate-nucleotide--dimethylbenzimidazole phosphoribosyltransferase|tara:strand:+ start:21773 stop:21967 length:195 start_codon:yes stop_codon:yes gene_type:complete